MDIYRMIIIQVVLSPHSMSTVDTRKL